MPLLITCGLFLIVFLCEEFRNVLYNHAFFENIALLAEKATSPPT